jgi:hypothetical protein
MTSQWSDNFPNVNLYQGCLLFLKKKSYYYNTHLKTNNQAFHYDKTWSSVFYTIYGQRKTLQSVIPYSTTTILFIISGLENTSALCVYDHVCPCVCVLFEITVLNLRYDVHDTFHNAHNAQFNLSTKGLCTSIKFLHCFQEFSSLTYEWCSEKVEYHSWEIWIVKWKPTELTILCTNYYKCQLKTVDINKQMKMFHKILKYLPYICSKWFIIHTHPTIRPQALARPEQLWVENKDML